MAKNIKNILVIGETVKLLYIGVGKTSLINVIMDRNAGRTGVETTACTFSNQKYRQGGYCYIDTVGYNDGLESNPQDAIKNLVKLALDLGSEGISLIIYVMRKGRINATSRKNYDYFVRTFCKNNVPVLLVVTHCEEEGRLGGWYASQHHLFESYKMNFAGVVSGCTVDLRNPNLDLDMLPFLEKKRKATLEEVKGKIAELALLQPWIPKDMTEWVGILLKALVVFGISFAVIVPLLPTLAPFVGHAIVALLAIP